MTTYVDDGQVIEVNGIEFEGVVDHESRWAGFKCLLCDESFRSDPADHDCPLCQVCQGSGEVLDHVNYWGKAETRGCGACQGSGEVA